MRKTTIPPGTAPRATTVVVAVRTTVAARGQKRLEAGAPAPVGAPAPAHGGGDKPLADPAGRVPRVARVLALAHRWQGLIDDGTVRDQADLARVLGVSRARVSQVMDLLRLAPDLQETILVLPRVAKFDGPRERDLRAVAAIACWSEQRRKWTGTGYGRELG